MLYSQTLARAARYSGGTVGMVDGTRRVTYKELAHRVERLAGMLAARGFSPGDRLAFLLPNSLEFAELTFACARLGVIAVPMNTRYSVAEMDEVLEDASPRGFVGHAALSRPRITTEWSVIVGEGVLEGSDDPAPPPVYDPTAILGLFYTSGTTGRAKGVMLTHANLLANMLHCSSVFPLGPREVWLHAAPMFHLADFPLILSATMNGASQITVPRFDPKLLCETIARERVTQTVLIPTMVNFLTQCPELGNYDLSSWKILFYGGAPMAPEIIRRTREKLPGLQLRQGYGMTEGSPLFTVLEDADHEGERIMSCGRPIPGVEVRVVDFDGKQAPADEPGEIVARGANIMKGYWNNPEATRNAFFGDWLRTGDVAYEDEEGYLYIVDRRKDMIVTGGENVYSSEVEAAVYAHPAVKEAAVIGVPDPQWGEAVMACVVLKEGAAMTLDDLAIHCRERIANYKVPRRLEVYPGELPKSGTGKILKRALREPFWAGQARQVG